MRKRVLLTAVATVLVLLNVFGWKLARDYQLECDLVGQWTLTHVYGDVTASPEIESLKDLSGRVNGIDLQADKDAYFLTCPASRTSKSDRSRSTLFQATWQVSDGELLAKPVFFLPPQTFRAAPLAWLKRQYLALRLKLVGPSIDYKVGPNIQITEIDGIPILTHVAVYNLKLPAGCHAAYTRSSSDCRQLSKVDGYSRIADCAVPHLFDYGTRNTPKPIRIR